MPDTDTLERPGTQAATGLRVDRDTLLTAVRAVRQTVERRNTIPILSNVLLRVENGLLTICASDLDHWSRRQIAYEGQPIDTTVEAERLLTAIDTLRPGAIDIGYLHGALTIKQGRSTRKLMTMPSTDFPVSKAMADSTGFAIDAAPLLRVLETARVCVSQEETRYYLCGVFLHIEDSHLIAASTDGHRVVQVKHPAPVGSEGMPDSIIGTKAVSLICAMLADLPEGSQVEVSINDKGFAVSAGRASIAGKLVDATYPQYRRVLRFDHASTLEIQSTEWDRSIRAAGSASDGKTRAVRLELDGGRCEAIGSAADGGRSIEPMDGSYNGPEIVTGVNLIYAQSIAKIFGPTPKLSIGFGSQAPDLIMITSDDRPGVIAGVMPMRA
ncbi:DNA polymerase III subunit beta [Sphingobium abikonense]|uniref:DNA polymerase III subunit beta n=1 Tax=Sphingobium abikonense TaxID=86193 RepID=UPI0035140AFC